MRIVLLVVDSLRADVPGYAQGFCETPALDRLAREALVCERCFSSAPWTVPSISAMVTGAFAHRLGLYRWDQALPALYPSIFLVARDLGYVTASFVFDPQYLFAASPEASVVGSSQELGRVIDWLEACQAPNLLLLVHVWSTHFPYVNKPMSAAAWDRVAARVLSVMNAEPSVGRAKARALYRRAVQRFSEEALPRIVTAACTHAGRDGVAVVLTGDHGESWGDGPADHGKRLQDVFDLHGNHLRDEVLAVPLLVWAPGRVRAGTRRGLARTVDIAPTLAELMGDAEAFEAEGDLGIDGRSLLTGEPRRIAVACQSRSLVRAPVDELPTEPAGVWTAMAVRAEGLKYVWDLAGDQRFAIEPGKDPGEVRRLPPDAVPKEGWAELDREWARAACAPPPDPVKAHLSRLGYLS